ncbi:MAG: DUF192 domain-containing protein [Candidatus Roizmanbacteria bacterium]|nr:DUF192 domain-containing protein [Candidatus Roizmanbacteria bacterium]
MRSIVGIATVLLIVGTVIILAVMRLKEKPTPSIQTLTIGNAHLDVTLADTDEKREQGLSGKPKMGENEGMLFTFPVSGTWTFWMKDMLFDLDFIYIKDQQVIALKEHIPAPKNNNGKVAIIEPSKEFDWLVEVHAGWVEKNSITIGQRVEIN